MKVVWAACILLVAASCSGGGAASPTAPTTSPSPSAIPSPSVAPSVPVLQDPAPLELQGIWITTLKDGSNQQVQLRLGEKSYAIARGSDGAAGTISVRADLIEFTRSSACVGVGSYRWSLKGTSLSLTLSAIGSEDCPGRGEVLDGYTYTKRDSL